MANIKSYIYMSNIEDDKKRFASMLDYDARDLNDSSLNGFLNRSFPVPPYFSNDLRIPLYITIFSLSILGNSLVIVTLAQNRRMRTVTNVFLLNLAVSDLLLSVFCMPFTLIPFIMQTFIFGHIMCIVVRYCQGISAAVSCFTLVAISLERYFAICKPLKSRTWQTLSHSYKSIIFCWISASVIMFPVALYSTIKTHGIVSEKVFMCGEEWSNKLLEKVYAVVLDVTLLIIPLALMSGCYGSLVVRMWKSMRFHDKAEVCKGERTKSEEDNMETTLTADNQPQHQYGRSSTVTRLRTNYLRVMTSRKASKQNAAKRRVIAMLFMVVLEYFVCWTPLHILVTWKSFDGIHFLHHISPLAVSLVYLLAYASSCCNPVTYCFMNKKFRQGFISAFSYNCCRTCCRRKHYPMTHSVKPNRNRNCAAQLNFRTDKNRCVTRPQY